MEYSHKLVSGFCVVLLNLRLHFCWWWVNPTKPGCCLLTAAATVCHCNAFFICISNRCGKLYPLGGLSFCNFNCQHANDLYCCQWWINWAKIGRASCRERV